MGLSQSTPQNEEPWPPAVQTSEELLERYMRRHMYTNEHRTHWFQEVFSAFCDRSGPTWFWSEESLATCLECLFPQELEIIVKEAAPIIHRYLRRIGSFPYQNDPEELLKAQVLRTGIFSSIPSSNSCIDGKIRRLKERVYFQSMASVPAKFPEQDSCLRDEADDEDLINALHTTRGSRRYSNNMKIIHRGPMPPPPSHFRSSWSRNMEQTIPAHEFRAFLRLMVVLNLCNDGIDVCDFSAYGPQTERVTDSLLAAFQPGPDGILWAEFGQVHCNISYPLHNGLLRLLKPLVDTDYLPESPVLHGLRECQESQERCPYSMEEITSILKKILVPNKPREALSSGRIYNLPILSQLRIILPNQASPDQLILDLSIRHDQINAKELKSHMDQTEIFAILLVSGDSPTGPVKFGLFNPVHKYFASAKHPLFIQLEPIHRVFGIPDAETPNLSIQVHPDDNDKPAFTTSVSWRQDDSSDSDFEIEIEREAAPARTMVDWLACETKHMSLGVGEDGRGRFTVQTKKHKVDEQFSVNAVEFLQGHISPEELAEYLERTQSQKS